jgi:hypothetical protein
MLARATLRRIFRGAFLREFDCRNRPPSIVAPDGNSQSVGFVKRDSFNRPRLSVAEHNGFADKFGLRLMECAENRRGTACDSWHSGLVSHCRAIDFR